ncbi:hypothetical protein FVA74_07545 [Salinibacterium sp. dk2585]|uniref:hypothetical protein n=1 Tax=unclassified Salinibacterium TaxID=2632331 RepID=UPI0011C245A8|nr:MULTISPECIES: hypothetical protein [unclassified Salinibacterium]QEE61448.1 hypothetical protein FVA74_07545 [Salinibacterium sp. dk2585]TXK54125.1 hypothetical protein FVP63_08995 [Salinibacterium sp. dk5596]
MSKTTRGRALWVGVAVLTVGVAAVVFFTFLRGGSPVGGSESATPLPEVRTGFVLDRADPAVGGPDAVIEFDLETGESTVVYSAERIVAFAATESSLVVVSGTPDAHSVTTVDTADGTSSEVALPAVGSVDSLASEGERAAFRFTSVGDPQVRKFSNALLWLDASDDAVKVVERDGAPFEAAAWSWVPGTGEMLAIDTEEELLRFSPDAPENAEGLGEWEGIEAVSADGGTAIVRDHHDTVALSLDDGTATPFGPTPVDGAVPFGGDVVFLVDGPERVQKLALPAGDSGRVSSAIVVDDGESPRVLYRASEEEGVDGFKLAPDGRHVAVEVVPDVAGMVSDAYFPHARAVSIVTRIISVAEGKVVAEFPGFGTQWSASAG